MRFTYLNPGPSAAQLTAAILHPLNIF